MDGAIIKNLVFNNKLIYRLSRHVLYWTVILIYFSGFLRPGLQFSELLKANMIFMPIDIISTYILIYLILPTLLSGEKNIIIPFLLFSLLLIIHFVISYLLEMLFITKFSPMPESLVVWVLKSSRVLGIIFFSSVFIKTLKHIYLVELNYSNLKRKNVENKMAILTSQLHPHFLFNTLNNLYTLSVEKSEKVPDVIMKLSEVIRYITYDHNKTKVLLQDELEIIKSYIEIEKLRYDENLIIKFENSIPEDILKQIQIPPLLIFTFVENSFKHGVSKSLINPWINILIEVKNSILKLKIENSVDEYFEKEQGRQGIGLKNVQNRLALYYPKRSTYSIHKLTDRFVVDLEIKLK